MIIIYKSTDTSGNVLTYIGTVSDIYTSTAMSITLISNGGININFTQATILSSTSFFLGGNYLESSNEYDIGTISYFDIERSCSPTPFTVQPT